MSEDREAGFLSALEEQPGDDTSWLVFADWLEERGDPRGQYLRFTADLVRGEIDGHDPMLVREHLRQLAVTLPVPWTEQITRLRATRPLRFRIGEVTQMTVPEPGTLVSGFLAAGTVFASGGVAILLESGVAHSWVCRITGLPSRWPASHSAGQEPLEFRLMLPSQTARVIERGMIVDSPEGAARLKRRLDWPLAELELSVRATNCLESEGIISIGDLVLRIDDELLEIRNFGETTLREVQGKLARMGLSLGMPPLRLP
jgi:uncharacterized protein (TIGR02996 family)